MSRVTTNRRALDRLISGTGGVMDDIVGETLDETATFARQRVHVITGQTKGSIEAHKEDGTVTADFGAIFEIMRGGEHDFLIPAFREALGRANEKITDRLHRLMGGR